MLGVALALGGRLEVDERKFVAACDAVFVELEIDPASDSNP